MENEERVIESLNEPIGVKKAPLYCRNAIRTNKYTFLTFLPLNLFEQFSRLANFYFLIIVSFMNFPWSPINPKAALRPLIIVIGISAFREAFEDYMRWKSDQNINSLYTSRIKNGEWENCKWKDIAVSDIIYVKDGEQVPADIVLLSSSYANGTAYIDTCNLDGESNLKIRKARKETSRIKKAEDFAAKRIRVSCDLPNNSLYEFNGNMEIDNVTVPLDNSALILRGSSLRNTDFVIGLAVYTGHDTKIMKNSCSARIKRSLLERGLNFKLLSVLVVIFGLSLLGAFFGYYYEQKTINTEKAWYFFRNEWNKRDAGQAFLITFGSHVIIINAMVPISLYVTLEVVRVFQAGFMRWDMDMYDSDTKTGCVPRTTTISDDLGQIRYVFSDKTGTLTRNVMEFMKCSIGGNVYGTGTTEVGYAAAKIQGIELELQNLEQGFSDAKFMQLLHSPECPDLIKHFCWLLATNHVVVPEHDLTCKHDILFESPSPDECALVEAVADMGFVFTEKENDKLTVVVDDVPYEVTVLANFEFTSDRKRSSVVIRHPITNQIVLYVKGADDVIFSLLDHQQTNLEAITKEHLNSFSESGLRTLCLAYKILDEQWTMDWLQRLQAANCLVNGREEAMNRIADEVECNLSLIGATAIEDKLQEDVADTIDALLRIGIHVWVITGDKKETAINIGYACSLLSPDMTIINFDEFSIVNSFEKAYNATGEIAAVISGNALPLLLGEYQDMFIDLTIRCKSVICCRVSPLQKAEIVEIVKRKTKRISLAIGDGANDVGMILKADVGVGISGKEGRQAVLASDYAISKFKFLKKLLLVHGRLNLYRNIECIYYIFYKNMCFTFNQIVFGCYSHFSGATMYDSLLYTLFNVFFTSMPIVVYSGYDRDVSIESMMSTPELFDMDGKRDWLQSYPRFLLNLSIGVVHALVAFYLSYVICTPFESDDGMGITEPEFAMTVYFAVVTIVNVKMASLCSYWTFFHWFSIIGSVLIFPLICLMADETYGSITLRGVASRWITKSQFWLASIVSGVVVGIPIILENVIKYGKDTLKNRVLYKEKYSSYYRK